MADLYVELTSNDLLDDYQNINLKNNKIYHKLGEEDKVDVDVFSNFGEHQLDYVSHSKKFVLSKNIIFR